MTRGTWRGLLVATAVLALLGCVNDAGTSNRDDTPEPDAANADAGRDLDGASDLDGAPDLGGDECSEDAWFCLPDVAVEPDVQPADAGLGKPDFDKGEPGEKKLNGWLGDSETFRFTRYAGERLVCDISYPWLDPQMVDDCADCEFAYSATLGAPVVEVDEGACEEALGREGAVEHFGQGRTEVIPGLKDLYDKQGEVWTLVPGGVSYFEGERWHFFVPVEAAPAPETSLVYDGELDLETGQGFLRFRSVVEDGEPACDYTYAVADATPNEDCEACSFAWNLPYGELERVVEGVDCAAFGGLAGQVAPHGHAEPGVLYIEKQGAWAPVNNGTSVVDGSTWTFNVPL